MHIHSEDINSDCGLWFRNFGPALAGSAGPILPPLPMKLQNQYTLIEQPLIFTVNFNYHSINILTVLAIWL